EEIDRFRKGISTLLGGFKSQEMVDGRDDWNYLRFPQKFGQYVCLPLGLETTQRLQNLIPRDGRTSRYLDNRGKEAWMLGQCAKQCWMATILQVPISYDGANEFMSFPYGFVRQWKVDLRERNE